MTEKTAEWFVTQGAMGVMALLALAALVWMARQREKDREQCDAEKKALNEAHKQELREQSKALIAVSEKTLAAIDRLCELEERRHP